MATRVSNYPHWRQVLGRLNEQYHFIFILVGWFIGILTISTLQMVNVHIIDLLENLVPEAFGIGFTVFILDRLNDQREIDSEKQRLRREAGSRDNSTAISAIDWMRHEDWMAGDNGLLARTDMSFAQLMGADFGKKANLEGVNFRETDLRGAYIGSANLRNAYALQVDLSNAFVMISDFSNALMEQANLENTNMFKANLSDAKLQHANLKNVNLGAANLDGADLTDAELDGATLLWLNEGQFLKAQLNSSTILPDGSHYNSTRGLDQMVRFGCIVDSKDPRLLERLSDQ